jgi:hypothetical protein
MKDLKPLIYILLLPFGIVSVLFVITLFMIFIGNKEPLEDLLSMTGTLGDTLGGITTCLVSGLTLYYIISTFRDQNSINQHTKSANNFNILYDLLKRKKSKIEALSFPYNLYNFVKKGIESMQLFEFWIKASNEKRDGFGESILHTTNFWERLSNKDFEYLTETISIFNDFLNWISCIDSFGLIDEHKKVLLSEFQNAFERFYCHESQIIYIFSDYKTYLNVDDKYKCDINKWLYKIIEFKEIENKIKDILELNGISLSHSFISNKYDENNALLYLNNSEPTYQINKELFDKI